jgi:ribosomal protein S18 acetylase RimI-like enzyme
MSATYSVQKEDYLITDDPAKMDRSRVVEFILDTYWGKNRTKEQILLSLDNSLCFSLFHKEKQIGFVRVITDHATYAYLCDVIIDEAYRHKGLGTWMLECVLLHPGLKDLRRWSLITRDAQEFYKKIGFKGLENPERYMEMVNPN